ncbi:MAG: hypothetical protein GWP15_00635 [Nitrospirae bacterium]|nr:hypothetical protein [Nitrospirota bacterium]
MDNETSKTGQTETDQNELSPEELIAMQELEQAAALFGIQIRTWGDGSTTPMTLTDQGIAVDEEVPLFLQAAKLKEQENVPERTDINPVFVDDFVEALMHVPQFAQYEPSDKNRDTGSIPLWRKECNFSMNSYRFWPSKSLTGVAKRENESADVFWEYVAKLLFKETEKRLLVEEEKSTIDYLKSKVKYDVVSAIQGGYSVVSERHLYFDYNTAAKVSPEQIIEELDAVKNAYRELLEGKLREIISDKSFMQQLYKSASVFKRVAVEVVLQQDIELVDRIRSQSESEEDKKLFLSFVNQAVKHLPGLEDSDVQLLKSKDAILLGCQGLHVSSADNPLGEIYVPMTNYGNGHLRSWDEVMQTLAHEAAHAQIQRQIQKSCKSGISAEQHSQFHELFTFQNLAILRGLKMEMVQGENGNIEDIKVSKSDNSTQPSAQDAVVINGPNEQSPIAIANQALESAEASKRVAEEVQARIAKAEGGINTINSGITRFLENGQWPEREKSELKLEVEKRIITWLEGLRTMENPESKAEVPTDVIVKWIDELLVLDTDKNSELHDFNSKFVGLLREFREFVVSKGSTWMNEHTKCTYSELINYLRLLELAF